VSLHLREVAGRPVTITEREVITSSEIQGADEVNVLEQAVNEGIPALSFEPYEVEFLKLMFR